MLLESAEVKGFIAVRESAVALAFTKAGGEMQLVDLFGAVLRCQNYVPHLYTDPLLSKYRAD